MVPNHDVANLQMTPNAEPVHLLNPWLIKAEFHRNQRRGIGCRQEVWNLGDQ